MSCSLGGKLFSHVAALPEPHWEPSSLWLLLDKTIDVNVRRVPCLSAECVFRMRAASLLYPPRLPIFPLSPISTFALMIVFMRLSTALYCSNSSWQFLLQTWNVKNFLVQSSRVKILKKIFPFKYCVGHSVPLTRPSVKHSLLTTQKCVLCTQNCDGEQMCCWASVFVKIQLYI